jgi:hypothetical protein
MLDWLKRTFGGSRNQGEKAGPAAVPSTASAARIPYECWVWIDLPWEHKVRFLGFVYFDPQVGLSAKGGPENDPQQVDSPSVTVRLPIPMPMVRLSPEEISARSLPERPQWLVHYGPQPDPDAPWQREPSFAGRFHEGYPDDVQVVVHDGEPRRTKRGPELCWVRITAQEPGGAYVGTLLNEPSHLETVKMGDSLRFVIDPKMEHPLHVTAEYLRERTEWVISACDKCGATECFDPPSVMARLRFPDAPAGSTPVAFTAFCPRCGGMHMLKRRDAKN